MIKEQYRIEEREVSVSVSGSKVNSIMRKNIVKSACRIYKDGFIGIAGSFGETTDELWAQAEKNLSLEIPYACEPDRDKKRSRSSGTLMSAEDFLRAAEEFVDRARESFTNFIFSNKIYMTSRTVSLKNDIGLELCDECAEYIIMLMIKHRDSINIIDTSFELRDGEWNTEKFLSELTEFINAYENPVELPKREKLKLLTTFDLNDMLFRYLHGHLFGSGASPLANKVGEKVFSEKLCLAVDRTTESRQPFFDCEGTTLEGDMMPLIENGVVLRPYTSKKVAAEYGFDKTACGEGDYDDVPNVRTSALSFVPGEKSVKELLGSDLGVLVVVAGGGDYNDDGGFASPVQSAFLTDGERLIGRLPEFSVLGSFYEIFGGDYIGCGKDRPFFESRFIVNEMKISGQA